MRPAEIIRNRANSLHPPTYFLALSGWTALAGNSEFSLRFLSVCGNMLAVPMIYQVSRKLFADRWTGYLAALFIAVNPANIVYAQETRVYALLPVAYLLVISYSLTPNALRTRRDWLYLALSELACLYLHLFSVFILLAVNLLLLMTRLWRSQRQAWRRWIVSLLIVGLLWGAWLLTVWHLGSDVPAKVSSRDWRASGISLRRFYRTVWTYLNTGLVGIEKLTPVKYALRTVGCVAALATPLALAFDRRRNSLFVVLGALVLPLLGAYPVWYMRPLAHPRYLLFLVAPLLLVLARATVTLLKTRRVWIVSFALLGSVLVSDLMGLEQALFEEQHFRFDARGLSSAIAESATAGEVALMPPKDYSLWYYDPAPAEPVTLPGVMGTSGGDMAVERLSSELKDRPGAFLVTYPELRTVDPRDQVPFLLEKNGRLIDRFVVDRMRVDHYALGPKWMLPSLTRTEAPCGPLALTGVYTEATTEDGAVTAALRWQLRDPIDGDLKVVVRLWDGARQIASADVRLLNEQARPTSLWEEGDEAVNYYVLPLPLGTPPLTYSLSVRVYGEGSPTWRTGETWLPLGSVQLSPTSGQRSDPYDSWRNADWRSSPVPEVADGLLLEGYATRPDVLKPGDTLYVTLRWRALVGSLPHYAPVLTLHHDGTVVARDRGTLFERYITERWEGDELLIETRQLSIPATLDTLQLMLRVEGRVIRLGEVSVTRDALRWDVPATAQPACARLADVAQLVGYDWRVVSDQPRVWELTLYWQALDGAPSELSYTVFTHLLAPDGALLAQHDGLPARGTRPTTTWVAGEIVDDGHRLRLSREYTGPATLQVGMYDLTTMTRLLARDCTDRRLSNNSIHLTDMSIGARQ
ncbi:MAG: glycosyltransferase family 39 protein [Anaerolineae bacterium]